MTMTIAEVNEMHYVINGGAASQLGGKPVSLDQRALQNHVNQKARTALGANHTLIGNAMLNRKGAKDTTVIAKHGAPLGKGTKIKRRLLLVVAAVFLNVLLALAMALKPVRNVVLSAFHGVEKVETTTINVGTFTAFKTSGE